MRFISRTLVYPLLLYGCMLLLLIHAVLQRTGGVWIYPLDDAYIHMAMARHFAEDGVWGLTPYAFSSTTSSPLYTLLLAGMFFLFGVHTWIPLVAGVMGGVLTLLVMDRLLDPLPHSLRVLLNSAYVLILPLPVMAVLGMEHTLHIPAILLFFSSGLAWLEDRARLPVVLFLAALATALRYESLFLAAMFVFLLLVQRRFRDAVFLAGISWVPVVLYGLVSLSHGWGFLPSTVRLKGASLSLSGVGNRLVINALTAPELIPLFLFLVGFFVKRWRESRQTRNVLKDNLALSAFSLSGLIFLHMALARTGWFFRYEAYLITLGFIVLARYIPGFQRFSRIFLLLGLLLILILSPRRLALFLTPQAAGNIHDMQVQTARFLRAYYEGEKVALVDVGAPNFFADLRCVDLVGLGDIQVARMRLAGKTEEIPEYVEEQGVRVAIFYEKWFPELRGRWVRVGTWTIPDNLIAGDSVISFFAVDSDELPRLREAFLAFSRDSLPPSIRWRLDP